MLHLVSLPALSPELVARIAAGDDVVLQQGSIWAILNGHRDNSKISQLLAMGSMVFVIQEQLEINGLDRSQMMAGVNIIDYAELVKLTIKNPVIHTWC